MGKDTSILDEIQFRINSLQSEIDDLNELIDEIESSEDLKSDLALMSSNIASEISDMLDLLDGYAEGESFEEGTEDEE